jgi:hypothetical protein
MNRVLWILLVIGLSLIASILGATLAAALKSSRKTAGKKRRRRGRFEDEDDEVDTTRNAPKGAGAVVFWVLAGFGCGGLALLFGISLIVVLVKNMGDGGGGPPPPPPGFVENPDDNPGPPPAPEDLGPKEKQTQLLGATQEPTFKDQAPPGGWLIGFDVGVGEAFGVELVRAIQPRYQTPQGEAVGRKFGRNFSKTISVRARPGYAVGSIYAKAGLVVNGFSVQFMRIKGDRLDPADNYSSDWIGDHTGGGPPILLAGDGTRIIGIIGRRDANDVTGLGLLKQ